MIARSIHRNWFPNESEIIYRLDAEDGRKIFIGERDCAQNKEQAKDTVRYEICP